MRQQDFVRVRLRGEDGLRQLGLQLQQPGTAQAASQIHQRPSWHEQGIPFTIIQSSVMKYYLPLIVIIFQKVPYAKDDFIRNRLLLLLFIRPKC